MIEDCHTLAPNLAVIAHKGTTKAIHTFVQFIVINEYPPARKVDYFKGLVRVPETETPGVTGLEYPDFLYY